MSRGPELTNATPDDWIVTFQMRRKDGKRYARHVAVNGWVSEAKAIWQARLHVNPPRATREGRVHQIMAIDCVRFHLWKPPPDVRPRAYPMVDTMKV